MTQVQEVTGADWVWLMAHMAEHDKAPSAEVVIARMTSLTESQAMALPVAEFRELFARCSYSIVGDDSSD